MLLEKVQVRDNLEGGTTIRFAELPCALPMFVRTCMYRTVRGMCTSRGFCAFLRPAGFTSAWLRVPEHRLRFTIHCLTPPMGCMCRVDVVCLHMLGVTCILSARRRSPKGNGDLDSRPHLTKEAGVSGSKTWTSGLIGLAATQTASSCSVVQSWRHTHASPPRA